MSAGVRIVHCTFIGRAKRTEEGTSTREQTGGRRQANIF